MFPFVLLTDDVSIQHPVDSVEDFSAGAAAAYVTYEPDGDVITITNSNGVVDVGDWIVPKAIAPGAYTIRAEVLSGTLSASSSATNADLALTSARSWGVEHVGPGSATATIRVTIKLGGATLAIRDITLTAIVT